MEWFADKRVQYIGWSDFWEKKRALGKLCQIDDGPQIPKFHFEMLLFNLAQGLRGPHKICQIIQMLSSKILLPGFWYPGESNPARGVNFFKLKIQITSEILTKIKNI